MLDYLNTHAESITATVVVFLTIFSILVFAGAVYSRWLLNRKEKKQVLIREKLSELVIRYVSNDVSFEVLKTYLSSKTDYSILMRLTNELEKSLEGDEKRRLKRLLNLPPIRNYYIGRFESGDPLEQAKACLYFSRQTRIKKSIVPKIFSYTSSEYPMLAYSACLAIIIHGSADFIQEAIHNLLINEGISNQALNDVFKEFQAQSEENSEIETEMLIRFIAGREYGEKRTAFLIRALGELNFYESAGFLLSEFQNLDEESYSPDLACALIEVLAHFGMAEILDKLHTRFAVSPYREVREISAKAMGVFVDPVSIPILKWLLLDPDFYVRYYAAKSLSNFPSIQLDQINLPGMDREEYSELLGEIESSKDLEY